MNGYKICAAKVLRTIGVYIVVAVFADNDVDYDGDCHDFDHCDDYDR